MSAKTDYLAGYPQFQGPGAGQPIDPQKSVSFSGYRPEKFGFPFSPGHAAYHRILQDLDQAILFAVMHGKDTFLCGMAQGFDTACGMAVLRAKKSTGLPLRLVCVLPYAGQSSCWAAQGQADFDHLCQNAWQRVVLSPRYYTGCLHVRNRYLISHSSLLICYYSGKKGGTAYTVGLAKKHGLAVENLFLPADEGAVQQTLY